MSRFQHPPKSEPPDFRRLLYFAYLIYRSVIGSVVGTCLGILGTTINNRMRMKELRQIVRDASLASSGVVALTTSEALASAPVTTASLNEESLAQIKNLIDSQQKDLKSLSGKVKLTR